MYSGISKANTGTWNPIYIIGFHPTMATIRQLKMVVWTISAVSACAKADNYAKKEMWF